MEIRCVKGMCGLKVAGREENLGFKGLSIEVNGRTVGTFRIVRYIVGVRF